MSESIFLSVVIPTYNRMNSLETIFKSLVEQDVGHHKFEVIFVNDGSKDQTISKFHELQEKYNTEEKIHKNSDSRKPRTSSCQK